MDVSLVSSMTQELGYEKKQCTKGMRWVHREIDASRSAHSSADLFSCEAPKAPFPRSSSSLSGMRDARWQQAYIPSPTICDPPSKPPVRYQRNENHGCLCPNPGAEKAKEPGRIPTQSTRTVRYVSSNFGECSRDIRVCATGRLSRCTR